MKTRQWQPHLIAVIIFFIVSLIYCLPAFKGLVIEQHDIQGWKGMAQQSFEFKAKYGHFPLWTNSLFSGMPATQIALESSYNVSLAWLNLLFTLSLPQPANLFFLACVGFYILTVTLNLRTWIGIFGSLAYAYASYNAVISAVGHTSKFASMGYMPAVIAGLILLSNRKYLLGFITTLTFTTLLFYQNHIQIVYYTFLTIICLAVAFAVKSIRDKEVGHLGKTAAMAIAAAALGVLSYSVMLFPTYAYTKETMRGGKSELTINQEKGNKTKGGLDKDYAFGWSYGIPETFTTIVPRIYGGSSGTVLNGEAVSEFGDDTKTSETLVEKTGMQPEQANQYAKSFPAYWGAQPSTSGPVYFGAVLMTVFIFGLCFYKGWHKNWLLAATLLGLLMAWGKNFPAFNYFLFDYLPLYNKFRAPSMALIIPQLTVPVLACLGLESFLSENSISESFVRKLKTALFATAGVVGILVVLYFALDFKGVNDSALRDNFSNSMLQQLAKGGQPNSQMQQEASNFGLSLITSLKEDRKALYFGDMLRSLLFMAMSVAILYLVYKKKITTSIALISLTALSVIDLIGVDLRYLSSRNYVEEEQLMSVFNPTSADLEIKKDTGYYRVFDQTDEANGPFMSSRASYHHNSVGGYHPAKLALYDDLIKQQLSKGNMQVFNMLNTKYFIGKNSQNGAAMAQLNPDALGPVWFVKSLYYVDNADMEMKALDNLRPRDTAVLDKREQVNVAFQPTFDSSASIRMLENLNDLIRYESNSNSNQFAVFSEVFYPNGWKAFVDNKEVPIAKVNYILRGLSIPAGKHEIVFTFAPAGYKLGDLVSLIVGIISILLVAFGLYRTLKDANVLNKSVEHNG